MQTPVLYKQRCRHSCTVADIFAPVPNFPHRCKNVCTSVTFLHRCQTFRTSAKKRPHRCNIFCTGAKLSSPEKTSAPEEKMVGFYWCCIYGTSSGAYAPLPVSIGAPLPVPELSYKPVLKSFPRELPLHQFHQCIYKAPVKSDHFFLQCRFFTGGESLAPVQKCNTGADNFFSTGAESLAPVQKCNTGADVFALVGKVWHRYKNVCTV